MNDIVKKLMDRNQFSDETKAYSGIMDDSDLMFTTKNHYSGLKGFREIVATLNENRIDIGHIEERELFIKVYRFLATKHVLNTINWDDFKDDLIFQLGTKGTFHGRQSSNSIGTNFIPASLSICSDKESGYPLL